MDTFVRHCVPPFPQDAGDGPQPEQTLLSGGTELPRGQRGRGKHVRRPRVPPPIVTPFIFPRRDRAPPLPSLPRSLPRARQQQKPSGESLFPLPFPAPSPRPRQSEGQVSQGALRGEADFASPGNAAGGWGLPRVQSRARGSQPAGIRPGLNSAVNRSCSSALAPGNPA